MKVNVNLWIALITVYLVWGSTYLAIRYAVETIPPLLHASLRYLTAGAILFVWRRAAGDESPTSNNWKATAVVGSLLLLGGNGLISLAETRVPSGIAALMFSALPFWLVLFETLRKNGSKPSLQSILGLIIGFGGVFLLVGPTELTGSDQRLDTLGIIMMLFSPFFWSLGSIYARGADMPKSTLISTGMQMLMGSVALLVASLVTGELNGFRLEQVSMRSWEGLLYLITFGSLVGFVSYGWLLHNAPVSLTSTYAYVNPIVALFLGWLFAREELNTRIIVASVIILGSVIFINYTQQTAPRRRL